MEEFNKKEAKGYFNKMGISYFVLFVLSIILQLFAGNIVRMINPDLLENGNVAFVLTYCPLFIIVYPSFLLLISKLLPQTVPIEKKKMSVGQIIIAFIMTYAVLYVGNIIGVIITTLLSLFKGGAVNNGLVNVVMETNWFIQFVIMVIIAPIFEELMFRKFLIDRAIKYGEGVAIVLSGVLFGLFHGNFSQAIYATAMGFFFGFIYVRTGNIKYTVMLHMMVNFMGSVLSGLVLKLFDIQKMTELLATDMNAYMNFVQENAVGIMIYAGYILFLIALTITGIVLWIVNRKKFYIESRGEMIPTGSRFNVVFCNIGMILFVVGCLILFVSSVIA